jgi:pyruvate/2-oxoglutarate dehydrogenase complex dihydrolipoamide dehydrogenase (E3) component
MADTDSKDNVQAAAAAAAAVPQPELDFSELEQRMMDELDIQDRRYRLSKYKQCFIGSEAVVWMLSNDIAKDEEDAVRLGNMLLNSGMFHHVTRDHEFKNENLFYRFRQHENTGSAAKNADGTTVSWSDFLQRRFAQRESRYNLQPDLRAAADCKSDDTENETENINVPETAADAKAIAHDELQVAPMDEHNVKLLDAVHPVQWVDPEPKDTYNMVVIGAGAGGLVTAAGCAGVGARVAIIERHLMGGDCLNTGCVPSKALLSAAKIAHTVRNTDKYGVYVKGDIEIDFPRIMERMRKFRADISRWDSAERFAGLGVDVFIGSGKFIDKHRIEVNGKILKFGKATIATGGSAYIPPIRGLPTVPYYTNATIFNLTKLPKRLAVIGPGPIGCELAQAFARFGSKVHVFMRGPNILGKEDVDAAQIVRESMQEDGVTFCPSTVYTNVKLTGNAGESLTADSKDDTTSFQETELSVTVDGKEQTIIVDAILIAAGRRPNVQNMGLEAAGVEYHGRRGVIISETAQTSQSHIYAVGDCASQYQFTHVADFMARLVVRNALFFGRNKVSDLLIPWCTYTDPEVAHVGLYPHDLDDRGIDYDTFTRGFEHVDRAILESSTKGFVKIHTVRGTDEIVGATIVGQHAGSLISEVTLAMQMKTGLGAIASVIHPYPTRADAIRGCGDAYNKTRLTPTIKSIFRNLMSWQR